MGPFARFNLKFLIPNRKKIDFRKNFKILNQSPEE